MIESKLTPTFATVDSCFDLVRSHQYGIASYEVFSWSTDIHTLTKMVMTSDETQIQILANWSMSHAKRVTRDNWKNPEYHVTVALRNLRTDTNCPAGKSWLNHVNQRALRASSFLKWTIFIVPVITGHLNQREKKIMILIIL